MTLLNCITRCQDAFVCVADRLLKGDLEGEELDVAKEQYELLKMGLDALAEKQARNSRQIW